MGINSADKLISLYTEGFTYKIGVATKLRVDEGVVEYGTLPLIELNLLSLSHEYVTGSLRTLSGRE
jgi:hypothetical protein